MELTQTQIESLVEHATNGPKLKDFLKEKFPKANITIIRGDEDSGKQYFAGAYFSKNQAMHEAMNKLLPEKKLPGKYSAITGTVEDFLAGRVTDHRTREAIDATDVELTFLYLAERLSYGQRN